MKVTNKKLTFDEVSKIMFDKNTIILNEKTKNRRDSIIKKEQELKNRKNKWFSEVIESIETLIIWGIIIILFTLVWLMGIKETHALNQVKSILNDLSLNDCRLTQWESEHIVKWKGSMYATDIACVRWKSFEVFTPTNRDIYLLEKIGYDDRLWNFLVLKHWDLRFVYAHTITELKEWASLKWWELLGKVNVSWLSTNYHLHIELWAYRQNIKWDYLYWEEPTFNEKSFDLRMQRNIVSAKEINEIILEFIWGFEGMHLKSYSDWSNRYSIGYGTKSYPGEVISKTEAENRARIVIQWIKDRYELYKYDLNVQKAVCSFVYNLGSLNKEQLRKLENWFYKALANDIKQYNKFNWKVAWGLTKRRSAEYNLLTL